MKERPALSLYDSGCICLILSSKVGLLDYFDGVSLFYRSGRGRGRCHSVSSGSSRCGCRIRFPENCLGMIDHELNNLGRMWHI